MIEDRLLIGRFNQGDPGALCRIYEKYRDGLLKVAVAVLHDRSGSEDVLHDVFVAFARTAGRFELCGGLKAYLAVCVANRARDHNRATRRSRVLVPSDVALLPADAGDPEQQTMGGKLAAQLDTALRELPEEQRDMVVLHLQGELSFRDIAREREISINTAMSRYRYGLAKLRSALDGELKP
jgi:RNA polymerase sigma-70 factor, ECF subfamily